jgi:hypothetical protein
MSLWKGNKEHQNLLRDAMEAGQLSAPQPFQVIFARVGSKQCNMRIYQGKNGIWTEFKEQ